MAKLNPGHYRFEVHYKSTVAINMPASADWRTTVATTSDVRSLKMLMLCLMVSNVTLYQPTTTNTYNNWGPIRDV